jgi:hypothetical protein
MPVRQSTRRRHPSRCLEATGHRPLTKTAPASSGEVTATDGADVLPSRTRAARDGAARLPHGHACEEDRAANRWGQEGPRPRAKSSAYALLPTLRLPGLTFPRGAEARAERHGAAIENKRKESGSDSTSDAGP